MTTPGRGADNPTRRVHHRLPGGGGRPGPGVGGHSGQASGSSGGQQSRGGLGDPPSRPREHPASHVCMVHGQDGGRERIGRGRVAAAGSALRAAGRPGLLAEMGPPPPAPLSWRRGGLSFTPPRGHRGLGQSQGTAGPTRRRPPAGTARGHAQTRGHRPALASGRAARLSLPWAMSGVPHAARQARHPGSPGAPPQPLPRGPALIRLPRAPPRTPLGGVPWAHTEGSLSSPHTNHKRGPLEMNSRDRTVPLTACSGFTAQSLLSCT